MAEKRVSQEQWTYVAGVTTGRLQPHRNAWVPAVYERLPTIEDIRSDQDAFNLGHNLALKCCFGGNLEIPTPPVGMTKSQALAFCKGVNSGEFCYEMNRTASSAGSYNNEEPDQWADLWQS